MPKLEFVHMIRYFVTGVNVLLFATVPFMIYDIEATLAALASVSASLFILAPLALGFLVDGFRLYQVVFKYKKRKEAFLKAVSKALELDDTHQASIFYSYAKTLSVDDKVPIERRHAEWIMLVHTLWFASAAVLASLVVFVYLLATGILQLTSIAGVLKSFALVGSVLLVIRLYCVSTSERHKLDNESLAYVRRNRERILRFGRVEEST